MAEQPSAFEPTAEVRVRDKTWIPGVSSPAVPEPTILLEHDTDNIIIDRVSLPEGVVRYIISKPGKEQAARWSVLEKDLHYWVSPRTREEYEHERYKAERRAEQPDPSEREARAERIRGSEFTTPKAKGRPSKKGSGQWGWSRKKGARNSASSPISGGFSVQVISPSKIDRGIVQGVTSDTGDEEEDIDSIEDRLNIAQDGFDDTSVTIDSTELAINRQLGGIKTRVFGKKYTPVPSKLSNQVSMSPSESEAESMSRQVKSTSIPAPPTPDKKVGHQKSILDSMMPPSASFTSKYNSNKRKTSDMAVDGSFQYTKGKGKEPEFHSLSMLPESPNAFEQFSSRPRVTRSSTASSQSSRPGTSDSANSATEPARKKPRRSSALSSAVEAGSLYQALEQEEKSMKHGLTKKVGSINSRYSKLPKTKKNDSAAEEAGRRASVSEEEEDKEKGDDEEDEEGSDTSSLGEGEFKVKDTLADRYVFDKAGNPIREFLLLWQGDWPPSENPTWEPEHLVGAEAIRDFEASDRPKAAFPDIKKKTKRPGRKSIVGSGGDDAEPAAKRARRKSSVPLSTSGGDDEPARRSRRKSSVPLSTSGGEDEPTKRARRKSSAPINLISGSESEASQTKTRNTTAGNRRSSRSASAATPDEEDSLFMPGIKGPHPPKRQSKSPYLDPDGDLLLSDRPRTRDSTSSREGGRKSVRFSQSVLDASEELD